MNNPLRPLFVTGRREVDTANGPGPRIRQVTGPLADFTSEEMVFTYALLIVYGGLTYNPIQEFANLNNAQDAVTLLTLPDNIFDPRVLPDPWCRLLWSCKREYWEALSLHMGSLAILDRDRRRFTRVVYQEIPALDIGRTAQASTFPLHSFGVDSNVLYGFFAPTVLAFANRPVFVPNHPRPETERMAQLLFREDCDISALVRQAELRETFDENNSQDTTVTRGEEDAG